MNDEDIRLIEVSFQTVCEPVPAKTIRSWIYGVLADLNTSTTMWKPGAVARLLISAVSVIAAVFSYQISLIARGGFLTLAKGAWKTLVAAATFNTPRLLATRAAGDVTLTNESSDTYSRPAESTVISGPTGKLYRNAVAFTIPANGEVTTSFLAVEYGSASSAVAGTVTSLVTTLLGVTAINSTAFVGRDDESDAALEKRALSRAQSESPYGPPQAYYWAALNAKRQDGSLIGISRVGLSRSSLVNEMVVTVATDAGAVPGYMADSSTDLGAAHLALVLGANPPTVILTTKSATNRVVPVSVVVLWGLGVTVPIADGPLTDLVNRTVVDYFKGMNIGGDDLPLSSFHHWFFKDSLRDAIVRGLADAQLPTPKRVLLTDPFEDIVLLATDVPVPGAISAISIAQG
jgi:hypothetical protein